MQSSRAVTFLIAAGFVAFADGGGSVPYPTEYRRWTVTRSFVAPAESRSAGFHHYYANEQAMEGFTTGRFPEGSVIVDERLAVEQRGGGSFEGKRISVAVMRKDNRRYADTGGWGFDIASGESQTAGAPAEVRAACHSCHSKQTDRDFVFSAYRQ
jgi:hypothetical protein